MSLATSLVKQLIVQVVVDNMTSNVLVKIQQTKGGLQRCSTTSVVIPHTLLASMAKQCPNAIQLMTDKLFVIDNHPAIPPANQLKEWEDLWHDELEHADVLLIKAFQAGADQELEACCEYLKDNELCDQFFYKALHKHRRPKPPSLAEEALKQLTESKKMLIVDPDGVVRRALEKLQELEGGNG